MFKSNVRVAVICLSLLALFSESCKKSSLDAGGNGNAGAGTRVQLTQDSIYLYAKETYLWNDVLPDYLSFNPRGYVNPDSTLSALTRYKINPKYNLADSYNRNRYLDKYSFIDNGAVATQLGGTGGDFGFSVFYNSENDLRIKYVYDSSPAALKGLKRGYQITKINGRTDLSYNSQANVNFVIDALLSGSGTTAAITVKAPDGTSQDVTLSKSSYAINPVLYRNVYAVGSKKIGYLVFNSFTTNATPKLDEAFAYFSANGVTELVVDLRYNGGGSVSTAEDLADYIVPASQNGKVMYFTYYNDLMQNNKATILKNQKFRYNGQLVSYFDIDYSVAANTEKFEKKGSLNLTRVYFIVTGSTASASELVINSVKPTLDVQLIGRRTYGKPVGFFAIHIDKYDMYIPQFQTKNQSGAGDYFDGMAVDKESTDDVTKDFGDTSERLLSYALGYANTGTFAVANPKVLGVSGIPSEKSDELTEEFDHDHFKGMIKFKLKPKQ